MPDKHEQLDFNDERAQRIAASAPPVETDSTDTKASSLDGQFNETEITAREGDVSFDGLRKIAATRSPDSKTRFEAANADQMPDPSLVKPSAGVGRQVKSRSERRPAYYDSDGNIRNRRLSSEEKGQADWAPEHIRNQFPR